MTINYHTKIASILRHNATALEAIISLSPRFEKLRNPILRKIMAGRTSIATAAKVGGCELEDFYSKLEPLGFTIDRQIDLKNIGANNRPAFIDGLTKENTVILDVRPVIASGSDPLQLILKSIQTLKDEQVLKIINSFEPVPLILLLQKRGFETFVENAGPDHIETYFFRKGKISEVVDGQPDDLDWDQAILKFKGRMKEVDVRHLEMPLPMHTILESLEVLSPDNALYIFHKKVPVFLLPELAERGFEYRIRDIKEGEVHLLVFKAV